MFDFFKSSRDKAAGPDGASRGSAAQTPPAEPVPSSRDLIRVVFRDTLRRNGIPSDWLACQIASHSQPGRPAIHQIQVVVVKWHESLLRFAPLLEQQLINGLLQIDPKSDPGRYSVVWSFAPNCGCPYTTMPPANYWQSEALKQKFDLPPTTRKFHEVDDDFATTVPSSLN